MTLETDTVTVAPLVDRVDTVFIADAEAFEAAKAAYGWGEDVTAPAQYPVLAVMPVVTDGLADVSLQIDGTSSSTGVWFVAVDMTDKTAGSQLTVTVTASKEGYPSYSDTATYILTAADIAKADTGETIYHYVTYRHMDAITADLVEPVADGESITLPTPERSGYTFLGWTADGSEVMLTAGTSYTPDGDVVLTANWAAQSTAHTLNIPTTVSYTHLDVYKRQILRRAQV